MEEGETKREALKREIKEETGIKNFTKIIADVHYFEFRDRLLIEYLDRHGRSCKHLEEYVFGVEVPLEEEVVLDEKEHSEFKWCSFEEALKLLKWKENKEALRRLNEILNVQGLFLL